jgi:hypothetical protein
MLDAGNTGAEVGTLLVWRTDFIKNNSSGY